MSNILVTGGTGLVGKHLARLLPDAQYISSKQFDLTSESDVARLFESRWDHVIHLAARVGGILDNIKFPSDYLEENVLMNTLLVKYARKTKVPRLSAVLSTCVFPDVAENYPLKEEDMHNGAPQKTNFAYAVSKRTLAVQIDASNEQYGTRYNYLIPCNLYGEHDQVHGSKSHFVTALVAKILKAEANGDNHIQLLGTGEPLRQFMYAGDLARVIKTVIDGDIDASFNVAVDENLSIRQIAQIALNACGMQNLELRFDPNSPDGQYRKDVSNARMKELIPGFEFTSLYDGIKKVYQHYKANNIV